MVLGDGLIDVEYDHLEFKNQVASKLPRTRTWCSPARSEHRLFRCPLAHTVRLHLGSSHLGEILSTGTMTLIPGCIHPNGGRYEIVDTSPVAKISESELFDLIRPYAPLKKSPRCSTAYASVGRVKLSDRQKMGVVNAVAPFWRKGQRHLLTMYLCGYLMKRGVTQEDTTQIVARICTITSDEEKQARLANVNYHYGNRVALLPVLKGYTGLRKIMKGPA